MVTPTANPIPSQAPQDFLFNVEGLDRFMNASVLTFQDRFGVTRKTLKGYSTAVQSASDSAISIINLVATHAQEAIGESVGDVNTAATAAEIAIGIKVASVGADAAAILAAAGYTTPIVYTTGLMMTSGRQTVSYNGNTYAAKADQVPFTTSGTFETTKFRLIEGVNSSDLASEAGAQMVGFKGLGTEAVTVTVGSELRRLGISPLRYLVGDPSDPDTHAAALNEANAIATAFGYELNLLGVVWDPQEAIELTAPIGYTTAQLFTWDAPVTISGPTGVMPEWFGDVDGNWYRAIEALPDTSAGDCALHLESRRYGPAGLNYGGGTALGKYISKRGVKIRGKGLPNWSSNCDRLERGSIIEGMALIYANDVELSDLGVDCGKYVVDTHYGGVITPGVTEGLLCTYPNQTLKDASALRTRLRFHNVRALAASPSAPVHAWIIAEGYEDVRLSGVTESCYGFHGGVIKGKLVDIDSFKSFLSGGEGFIIKTDGQATAAAVDVKIKTLFTSAGGPAGTTPHTAVTATGSDAGLIVNPAGGAVTRVQIGMFQDVGHSRAHDWVWGANQTIDGLQIDAILGDANPVVCANLAVPSGCTERQVQIGSIIGRNTEFVAYTNGGAVQIGRISGVNARALLYAAGVSGPVVGALDANTCDAVVLLVDQTRPRLGPVNRVNTPLLFDPSSLKATLANGWTQFAGNSPFTAWPGLDGLEIYGLLVAGTSNVWGYVPFWGRPQTAKRGNVASARNGSTEKLVPIAVGTDGALVMNEIAGGYSDATTWLGVDGVRFNLVD